VNDEESGGKSLLFTDYSKEFYPPASGQGGRTQGRTRGSMCSVGECSAGCVLNGPTPVLAQRRAR
jgi:hypothetical protein